MEMIRNNRIGTIGNIYSLHKK